MTRPVFITGTQIDLVPLERGDAPLCTRWLNDMEVIINYGVDPLPISLERQEEYLAGLAGRKDQMMLGIMRQEEEMLIGLGGLSQIEWINRRAELSIVIGDPAYRGRGYGTEATRLILAHAFNKLNLHNVMLRVIAYNARAVRCYEKCGFRLIGRRRAAKLLDQQYVDVLYMDILAAEFTVTPAAE